MDGILSRRAAVTVNIDIRANLVVLQKPSEDLAPGTLNSIFKQAGLKERQ
jgi:predicted RNA binding protein YcfA (HicA-like mRNA interferase family)